LENPTNKCTYSSRDQFPSKKIRQEIKNGCRTYGAFVHFIVVLVEIMISEEFL